MLKKRLKTHSTPWMPIFGALTALYLGFFCLHIAGAQAAANQISQYGITWYFDKAYEYGQFANGDYWVLGPVTITRITPDFNGTRNGWQVNPAFNQAQGFDDRADGFSASVVPSLPYNAQPGQSIVKSISLSEEVTGHNALKTIAVLTVVNSVPPGNGSGIFRPGYAGTNKNYYHVSDIRADRLLSIRTQNSGISFEQINDHFKMPQIEHRGGRGGRYIRALENMKSTYAPYTAGKLNEAIARLSSPETYDAKKESLIYVIQAGIDRYNAILTGQTWPNGGGHQPGHKLSVAFSAYMLDHQGMKNEVAKNFWWENRLIVDGLWGESCTEDQYWKYLAKDPGYNLERKDPYKYIDGGNNYFRKVNSYQIITAHNSKGAALFLCLMPGMKAFWSDVNNFAPYVERWVNHGLKAKPDPCAPIDSRDVDKDSSQWLYYGKTWGSDGNGNCIKGNGRFNDGRDGTHADEGQYQSAHVNELWGLCASGSTPPSTTPTESVCQKLDSTSAIPTGFGASYNTLTTAKEQLMNVNCETSSVSISLGNGAENQFIWSTAYVWRNSAWQTVSLTGPASIYGSSWLKGSANASVNLTSQELLEKNHLIAFICQWTGTAWKCGCRDSACSQMYWQIQQFGKY